MSAWIKVSAEFDQAPEDWSLFAEIFDRFGIPGTVQTDIPPTISGYLVESNSSDLPRIEQELIEHGACRTSSERVQEEDWAEAWKQYFHPRRIGSKIVVRPTWEPFELQPEDIEIVIDPGQAFGTGDHPTTRLCLELMDRENLTGTDVADIGCGTGILSVAARKLGAREVIAVDIDTASIESSAENATRNGVSYRLYQGRGFDPIDPRTTFDVVLSNIISAALIQLAPEAAKRVRKHGLWIVSGVIDQNWLDVHNSANAAGFTLKTALEESDWVAATFIRT